MTSNQQSVVDEDTFTVRRTILIEAPVEKVWTAVTAPEHISKWFGQAVFSGTAAGSTGTLTWPGNQPIPVRIEAVDEPRSVSYRWGNDDAAGRPPADVDGGPSTVFTFTLETVPGGTRLTVVETGFETTSDPLANLESHRTGWDAELDTLVALVEAP
ncbi:SRPBCC family protein [Nakamurella lactea]|uniref:SRPBCC family protein n=1 Tax=Nakamurella lactea TaxID=459515 RepID=UPI001B7FB6B4|nr:SRPBCC family protein [Nakamurella lactea]